MCNRIFSQLKSLTNVIERLGGRTELSDVPEKQLADHQTAEASHAAKA
jgi:hypothetical protein